jgi:hypothetical protein
MYQHSTFLLLLHGVVLMVPYGSGGCFRCRGGQFRTARCSVASLDFFLYDVLYGITHYLYINYSTLIAAPVNSSEVILNLKDKKNGNRA